MSCPRWTAYVTKVTQVIYEKLLLLLGQGRNTSRKCANLHAYAFMSPMIGSLAMADVAVVSGRQNVVAAMHG